MALSVNTFEKPDVDLPVVSFEEEEEVNLITEDKEEGERIQPVAGGVNEVELHEMASKQLIESSSSDDSDNENYSVRHQNRSTKWWFQEPAIRRNRWMVFLIIMFIVAGIACFFAGIALEIVYHIGVDDVIRGFVFVIIAIILLIPSIYAILHVYLAAKRVGRVRFSSVWFFMN